jgi:hypothetical protein
MHFGKKLIQAKHDPWAAYYLDYDRLKSLLKEDTDDFSHRLLNGNGHDHHPRDDDHDHDHDHDHHPHHQQLMPSRDTNASFSNLSFSQTSHQGLSSFVLELNEEVERILFFFLREQAAVAAELQSCRQDQLILQRQDSSTWMTTTTEELSRSAADGSSSVLNEDELLHQKYYHVAIHLLHLIQFVDLNMTGIRKILEKHDKKLHANLSKAYLGRSSTIMKPLLSNDSIDALSKIMETSFREWTMAVDGGGGGAEIGPPSIISQSSIYNGDHMSDPKAVLTQIRAARSRLKETGDFVKMLAAPEMLGESYAGSDQGDDEEPDEDERKEQERKSAAISNFLNLFSTFLYMTNYYIVAPASNTYAEKLGGSASDAGIIIGMTPVAALVSTLLYSWWTSYSYKSALIFASACSLTGNLFYGAGLPYNSMNLVLIGRLLN